MDGEQRFSVVIVHAGGRRDVRATNITLESAQAAQSSLAPAFPHARVLIEPPPPEAKKRGLGDTHRPGLGDTWQE